VDRRIGNLFSCSVLVVAAQMALSQGNPGGGAPRQTSNPNRPSNTAGGAASQESVQKRFPIPPVPEISGIRNAGDGIYIVKTSQPIETAIELIQRKFGVAISYEGPEWVSKADLVEARDSRFPDWKGPLVPRDGILDLVIPSAGQGKQVKTARMVIDEMLKSHAYHGNSGEFIVVQLREESFLIKADKAEDSNGGLTTQSSPLDVKISFPEEERTIAATLDLICLSIRETGKGKINHPHIGAGGYFNKKVRIGANDELARDVVARTLKTPGGPKYAWHVDYWPDGKSFGLAAFAVQVEVDVPGGRTLETLYWPK